MTTTHPRATDLAGRLDALGIGERAGELLDQGYTLVEGAFTDAFADELREEILRCEAVHGSDRDRLRAVSPIGTQSSKLLERGRVFERAVCNPVLVALMELTLGAGYVVSQVYGSVKGQGSPAFGLHTDYVAIPEPFAVHGQVTTAVFATDDVTVDGGCTRVVPGSNRLRRNPGPGEGESDAVSIACPKGSILVWDGATWHGNCARTEPGERVLLHTGFNRVCLRPFEVYDLPAEIIERNPPELASMLGLNDPFGKSTHRGADLRRLAAVQAASKGAVPRT